MPKDDKEIQGKQTDQSDKSVVKDTDKQDAIKQDDPGLGQFKTKEAMFESYKQIQGAYTRTSQDNKDLKEENAKLKEDADMAQYSQSANIQSSQDQTEDFDTMLSEDPRKAIENIIETKTNEVNIRNVLQEYNLASPSQFQGRYNCAQMISQNPKYAHLAHSAAGVKELFKKADKQLEEETKRNASKALEAILGGPVDDQKIAKLREVLGTKQEGKTKTNNQTQLSDVYMPDTSDTHRPDLDAQVDKKKEFKKAKMEAADKGDIDGAIEAAFGEALAE